MNLVKNKLKVTHIPQVPMEGFEVEVRNEREAYLIENTLANQHLFLFKNNVIPYYANAILVLMYNEQDKDWESYYNEEEGMEWEDFVAIYEDELK